MAVQKPFTNIVITTQTEPFPAMNPGDPFLSVNHPDYVPGKNKNTFSGIARSIIASDNNGFPNFKIVTLFIEKGKVVKTEYSDPYANFEAGSIIDLANDNALMNLNNTWVHGKAFQK